MLLKQQSVSDLASFQCLLPLNIVNALKMYCFTLWGISKSIPYKQGVISRRANGDGATLVIVHFGALKNFILILFFKVH